jgi:AcrR family transcriptional regulator
VAVQVVVSLRKWASVDKAQGQSPQSLAEEQRHLTRSRIRQSAMVVVSRRGFNATVEEIAQLSGVSPRTIFRHYASHDRLVAATVKDMFEACGLPQIGDDFDSSIAGFPEPGHDLDGWIDGVASMFHTRSASIFGAAFWDISAPHHNQSEVLEEVDRLRRDYRLRGISYLVNLVWQVAGGSGEPPEDLVLAFALNLSVFTTQALMVDFDQTPEQIGVLTADILKMLLRRAVGAQQSQGFRPPEGESGAGLMFSAPSD